MTKKEFLYVGHYTDTAGNYILKIGTTNNLARRKADHTSNYKKAKKYTMPVGDEFIYDWFLPLSRYNTRRYEDKNIDLFKQAGFGEYVRNDRFCFAEKPTSVNVVIKKTYCIEL